MRAKSIFTTILACAVSLITFAQRTDIKAQEKVQRDYQREHSNQEKKDHKVTTDRNGNVKETWISPNGDKNTYEKTSDGRVTTTVEHPDGTKEVNGVRQVNENKGSENQGGSSQGDGNSGNGSQGDGNKGNGSQGDGNKGNGNQGGAKNVDPMDRNKR